MAADKEKRTEEVKVRFTVLEKKQLRETSTLLGMSMADYLRACREGQKILHPDISERLASLDNGINRIGVNVNQLTKFSNTYKSEVDKDYLVASLEAFRLELSAFHKTVESWIEGAN